MTYPKIHDQIGIPIKKVDKTSTPQKTAKFKILNPKQKKNSPSPCGRQKSEYHPPPPPPGGPLNNLCITNIIQIIQITGKVIHFLAKIMIWKSLNLLFEPLR